MMASPSPLGTAACHGETLEGLVAHRREHDEYGL